VCSDTPIPCKSTTPRTPLYCCIPFVRLAQHLALTPGVLSRGRVRRLEYTVGAITNALFFAENEGWY
jgi:hypothetical protein